MVIYSQGEVMKQNASLPPLLVIVRLASIATRQGQAGKRKTTAFRLVLDPRYLPTLERGR